MAIKMIRQPSDTPNIKNIDDIIPFRYAYGDQNGYVLGKGSELSYTINGSSFTINSGRIVLQGVESDIDANGITLTFDNVSETRYYTIFYQVNLGTNSVLIDSTYDTVGFIDIEIGDDLTVNSSGISQLELYRLTISSGVISNVQKVVKYMGYINHNTVVDNAKNAENATNSIKETDGSFSGFIRDENQTLKNKDFIVATKKLLWEGVYDTSTANVGNPIVLNSLIETGDKLSIMGTWRNGTHPFEFIIVINEVGYASDYRTSVASCVNSVTCVSGTSSYYSEALLCYVPSNNSIAPINFLNLKDISLSSSDYYITSVYKIIE